MGWRIAFSKKKKKTTIPRDPETIDSDKQSQSTISPSPSFSKLGPSTPRLRCRTTPSTPSQSAAGDDLPKLHCKTATTPRSATSCSSSSPRSPFAILKDSLGLSRSNCGICSKSINRGGQGMAIYTAECSHKFHFPCVTAAIPRNPETLACPVCKSPWEEVPFLGIHKSKPQIGSQQDESEPIQTTPMKTTNQFLQPPLPISKIKTKYEGRAYGDDEPLKTPVAGARFVSIPEASDEDEEFRGFLNPVSSTSDEVSGNNGGSRSVLVSLMPEAAVVSVGATEETYAVVLKVKAPPPPRQPAHDSESANLLDPARRAPIDLVAVLDVSASMSGEKLQMMKRAMRLVVSSLGSADRLAIVAFSACPKRLLPLSRMTVQGQRAARRIIDRLTCSQGCCVPEALRQAAKVLEDRRERNPVASIMLLSDGEDDQVQPHTSDERPTKPHVSTTRFAHVEIPVESSSGYGYANEPAEDAFRKCVGGLLSVVVQDLSIELGFVSGSDPAVISAVYSCNGRPTLLNSGSIQIGDLYAEEERELLLELRVPVDNTFVARSHHVLSIRSRYIDPATDELILGREQTLLVPRLPAVRSLNPRIGRLKNLFITLRAIAEARRIIQCNNDLSSASQLLASARTLLLESGSAEEYVQGLDSELAEVQWRHEYQVQMEQQMAIQRRRMEENGEPLTPTSAWRAADQLAKVAVMKKSTNRVSDLHGFENARF